MVEVTPWPAEGLTFKRAGGFYFVLIGALNPHEAGLTMLRWPYREEAQGSHLGRLHGERDRGVLIAPSSFSIFWLSQLKSQTLWSRNTSSPSESLTHKIIYGNDHCSFKLLWFGVVGYVTTGNYTNCSWVIHSCCSTSKPTVLALMHALPLRTLGSMF